MTKIFETNITIPVSYDNYDKYDMDVMLHLDILTVCIRADFYYMCDKFTEKKLAKPHWSI